MAKLAKGRIVVLAEWLLELNAARERDARLGESLLHAVLTEYDRLARRPEDELVLRVQRCIRAHLAEPLALGDEYHLSRVFKRLTGTAPSGLRR